MRERKTMSRAEKKRKDKHRWCEMPEQDAGPSSCEWENLQRAKPDVQLDFYQNSHYVINKVCPFSSGSWCLANVSDVCTASLWSFTVGDQHTHTLLGGLDLATRYVSAVASFCPIWVEQVHPTGQWTWFWFAGAERPISSFRRRSRGRLFCCFFASRVCDYVWCRGKSGKFVRPTGFILLRERAAKTRHQRLKCCRVSFSRRGGCMCFYFVAFVECSHQPETVLLGMGGFCVLCLCEDGFYLRTVA